MTRNDLLKGDHEAIKLLSMNVLIMYGCALFGSFPLSLHPSARLTRNG